MSDILTRLCDWISFEIEFTGKEPDCIELSEYHWEEFKKALRPLGAELYTGPGGCMWANVLIKPKKGDKPMIKSFHHQSPKVVHTFVALEETEEGVFVRCVGEDGDYVAAGNLCVITPNGIRLCPDVDKSLGIKTHGAYSTVVVRDYNTDILM